MNRTVRVAPGEDWDEAKARIKIDPAPKKELRTPRESTSLEERNQAWGAKYANSERAGPLPRGSISGNVNADTIKKIEEAYESFPKELVTGIRKFNIKQFRHPTASAGRYIYNRYGGVPDLPSVNVSAGGGGAESVFYHEMHHHMWHQKRTDEQIKQFEDGVRTIMLRNGNQSPTEYSDTYAKRITKTLDAREKKITALDTKIKNNKLTRNDVLGTEYQELNSNLRWHKKRHRLYGEEKDLKYVESLTEKMKKMEDSYKEMSEADKIAVARNQIHEISQDLYNVIDAGKNGAFFNECHSEIGSYIHAGEDQTQHGWKINKDVIDQYVDLYHEVFNH